MNSDGLNRNAAVGNGSNHTGAVGKNHTGAGGINHTGAAGINHTGAVGINNTAAVGKSKAHEHGTDAKRRLTTSLEHAQRTIHHLEKELRKITAEEKGEEMADERTVKLLLDRLRNSYSKDPIKTKDQKNVQQRPGSLRNTTAARNFYSRGSIPSRGSIKTKDQKIKAQQRAGSNQNATAHSGYVPVKVKTFGARLEVERLSGKPPKAPKADTKKKKKKSFLRKIFPFHKRHQRRAGQ